MELIVSFPDDIEVSSGQLKMFSECGIDPKCLLKVYCFKGFQATLYFLVYC